MATTPPQQTPISGVTRSMKGLKKKIIQIYETFFTGEDITGGNPNFWNELFLLKVDVDFLDSGFLKMDIEQIIRIKRNIQELFYQSVLNLKASYQIKVVNALQTLCVLVRAVYRHNQLHNGFDVIDILVDFQTADQLMQTLIESVHSLLTEENPISLKGLALKLVLIVITAVDNVSQNTILEYLMMNSLFEAAVHLLSRPLERQQLGYDVVLLLAVMLTYRKYESANPYIVKLSILDDELALNGLGYVISLHLKNFNKTCTVGQDRPQEGFLSSLTNMVSNMFVAETSSAGNGRASDAVLLAMYEAVHLNRNFITVLTQSHPEQASESSTPVPPDHTPTNDGSTQGATVRLPTEFDTQPPNNILVTFLQYTSFVLLDIKANGRLHNAKLCMIIITCIVEDQYANSFLHDVNMPFRVALHRAPMRHRKHSGDSSNPARPLVCTLFDLVLEFMVSHMMKVFPIDMYLRCVGIVHRVLCYQKKCRVRLHYAWTELWNILLNLLKFVISNEVSFVAANMNIFKLAQDVVNLFNMFITYGDTFLPSPTAYDELYYEVVRMHQVFNNLHEMALKYSSVKGEWKEAAGKLVAVLSNVRSIITHFTPRIDAYAAANNTTALTQEHVLEVVRNNYDSLTLKLQDSLDQYERYNERPRETAFFTQLVRSISAESRENIVIENLEQQTILQEFSIITNT